MANSMYLVFGDLHGRILPAFRLATAWARENDGRVDGLLQVGDLGWFPDVSRLDKATRKHATEDPLELGAVWLAEPSAEADAVFAEDGVPEALWFTAGNHEDHDRLRSRAHGSDFPVDAYRRVLCIRDGHVGSPPGGLTVGALWGIDGEAPVRRRTSPAQTLIRPESAIRLGCSRFDVLLTHDSPRGAVIPDSGSREISDLIRRVQPAFAFFGHYHGTGRVGGDFGRTEVYHMAGLELRRPGYHAEPGSVGVLRWSGGAGSFEYIDPAWLRSFTRSNWRDR